RASEQRHESRIAGLRDHAAISNGDRVDKVRRLNDAAPYDLDRQPPHETTLSPLLNGRSMRYGRDMSTIPSSTTDGGAEEVLVSGPDYEAPDVLVVSERAQLRAIADDVRTTIVALLRERARSTQQLAHELGMPKGTVGHHLK